MSDLRFKIVLEYMIGNSLEEYKATDELPYEWSNLDQCRKAVELILKAEEECIDWEILLPLDDGTMHKFANFWSAAYFDYLVSIEIKIVGVGEKIYV